MIIVLEALIHFIQIQVTHGENILNLALQLHVC